MHFWVLKAGTCRQALGYKGPQVTPMCAWVVTSTYDSAKPFLACVSHLSSASSGDIVTPKTLWACARQLLKDGCTISRALSAHQSLDLYAPPSNKLLRRFVVCFVFPSYSCQEISVGTMNITSSKWNSDMFNQTRWMKRVMKRSYWKICTVLYLCYWFSCWDSFLVMTYLTATLQGSQLCHSFAAGISQ